MAELSRYDVGGNDVRTKNGVLKNKLNITDQNTLDDTETLLLSDSYEKFLKKLENEEVEINLDLIFEINKYFLGTLYSWAGKIRRVEISKDGTLFCASINIENELKLLDELISNISADNKTVLSEKLSVIHCEFNAIHPFREGNGRTIRLFLDLVALANGYKLIDFSKSSKTQYIQACISGMKQDYSKMKSVIYKGLLK